MNITESLVHGHIANKRQNQSPNPSLDDDTVVETPHCCPLWLPAPCRQEGICPGWHCSRHSYVCALEKTRESIILKSKRTTTNKQQTNAALLRLEIAYSGEEHWLRGSYLNDYQLELQCFYLMTVSCTWDCEVPCCLFLNPSSVQRIYF